MRVWRICRKPYVDIALDGIGGMYTSGRWHTKGHPIVYTAYSAALAALEVLVHVDPLTAPPDLRLIAIELPDDLSTEVLDVLTLPEGWHSVPAFSGPPSTWGIMDHKRTHCSFERAVRSHNSRTQLPAQSSASRSAAGTHPQR